MSPVQITAIVAVGLCLLLCVRAFLRALRGRSRGKGPALDAWAKQVRFAPTQLTAMRSLWQWYKTGNRPAADPLKTVSTAEVADMMKKCMIEFLPPKFLLPNEERLRQTMLDELKRKGFDDIQAQVVVGMKFGHLGPWS